MSICAYCGTDEKLTREHLIPDWYLQIDRSPEDVTFLERAKTRFIDSDPVIKDVCASCNNGPLSKLDGYGRQLYAGTLAKFIYANESFNLNVDFVLLAKWLLKISFNSARVNNTDLEILTDYAKVLISDDDLSPHFHIFVGSVAPSKEGGDGEPTLAQCESETAHLPSWFRIGVFRAPNFDSASWSLRHIAINSYCFYLLVPKLGDPAVPQEEPALLSAMREQPLYGVELPRNGAVCLSSPCLDSLKYSLSHIGAFPFSYNIVEQEILKRVIDGEFGLVHYVISKEDIFANHETDFLSFLSDIASSREVALGMRGKIEFSILGYDDDPRELYEIPEVVQFLTKIDQHWPYWMLFHFPHGNWLRILALCLAEGKRVGHGRVEFDTTKMKALIDRWFIGLNQLSHRYAISTSINKDVSEKAISSIFGSVA